MTYQLTLYITFENENIRKGELETYDNELDAVMALSNYVKNNIRKGDETCGYGIEVRKNDE